MHLFVIFLLLVLFAFVICVHYLLNNYQDKDVEDISYQFKVISVL